MNVFKKIKSSRQRGQIVLLYALVIPVLFLFVGLTFDLAWYYLNVSRMQNAADAAVLAGANKLIDQEQSLSDYNSVTFVAGYDINKSNRILRDISQGDEQAKIYVAKNIAEDYWDWDEDTLTDLWTQRELHFNSSLWKGIGNSSDLLYYHVMLEEDIPHFFLTDLFPKMTAKVSAVAALSYYLKGYSFFKQVKFLGDKQTYDFTNPNYSDDDFNRYEKLARSVLAEEYDDSPDENFNFDGDIHENIYKLFLNGFFVGNPNAPYEYGNVADDDEEVLKRIININEVYPVRDKNFFKDSRNKSLLSDFRKQNPEYRSFKDDEELAEKLAKEPPDPLYIRIEGNPRDGRKRQIIININADNMSDNYRPIIFLYESPNEEPVNEEPVTLNLNDDFRGVLFAPNSPVIVNGNNHKFQGFIVAKEYKKNIGDSQPIKYVTYYDFNLAESMFDSFKMVYLEEYELLGKFLDSMNNLLTTAEAENLK